MNWSHLMQLLNERTDRRTVRGMIADHLSSFLRFGEVVATKVVSGTGLRADVDVDGTVPRQETYAGQAGFLSRPQDGAEVVAWVSGDEAIVIATKDRRFEVAVEAGDVVVHSMPADASKQATIRLDGSTGDVNVTMPAGAKQTVTQGGSTERVLTESDIADVWVLLSGGGTPPKKWSVSPQDGGAALQAAAAAIYPANVNSIGSPALKTDKG